MLTDEHIKALVKLQHDNRLTPDDVLGAARKPTNPLHDLFEWDDAVAAEEHRRDQARGIIREVQVKITTTTATITVHRYVPDPDRGKGQGYLAIDPLPEEDMCRRIVVQECNRALGVMRRAATIAEALGMSDGVEEMIGHWAAWRDAVAAVPTPMAQAAD